MISLDQKDFKTIFTKQKCYIQFSAGWCQPCKGLAKLAEEIENEYKTIDFYKIDIDNYDYDFLKEYNIKSVPKVLLIKNGLIVHDFIGTKNKNQLIEKFKTYLGEQNDTTSTVQQGTSK